MCKTLNWNFQGLRLYRGSNFRFSYWFLHGPYNSAALQNSSNTRKCGNYSDVLPLKAARRDSISNLTSFGASNLSCRRPNAISSRAAVGATLMPKRGCAMDCELWQNKIVKVGKTSGPVLSRLWTKVHEILQQRRRPFALSNDVARLSVSCFIQQIFAIKCRSRRKPNKCKSLLAPNFFREGRPQLFYGTLLERPTVHRLTKCGWVPFADLRLRSLEMKWNAEFT